MHETVDRLERLRQRVKQAFIGIAMFDRDMRTLACSRRWLREHGLEEKNIVGRSLKEVFPEIPKRWEEAHRLCLTGERVSAGEDALVRADGRTQWLRWEARPWLASDGSVGGATIRSEDVTEKVEAERALRESELRMRLAQEAARVGTWEWWLADDRNQWSENLWSLYGLKSGNCAPSFEAWESSLHPEDRERATAAVRGAAALGKDFDIQWRVNLPDGEAERWLLSRGKPILGANGAPDRYVGIVIDITERKLVERALGASEERLRFCLRGANAAAWQWDFEKQEQVWPPESYDLHGRDPRLGKPSHDDWLHCLHPEDRLRIEQTVQEAVKRKASEYQAEYRVVHTSGEVRWLAALGKFDYSADGIPIRLSGLNFDITDRKRAEEAARKAEARERLKREELEAILAAIPAPVLIATDASCETMIGNPAAYELYRVPPGANIAKSAPIGEAPANFEVFQNGRRMAGEDLPIRRAAAKQTFSAQEIELRFVEGDSKFLLGNALPLLDDAGETRGAVAAFADVTELKRTEAALRESKARFRHVFSNNMAPMAIWEKSGGIVDANDAFLNLVGYTRQELEAGKIRWSAISPEGRARDLEALAEIDANGYCTPYEKVYAHKGGHPVPVIVGGGSFDEHAGTGVLFAVDLTQQKRTEEALANARRREAAGQLAGGVAHDFNNLLHVIAANLELALDFVWDNDARDLIQRAQDAAEKGSGLTRRLLSFTRNRALKPEFLNLTLYLEETAKLLQRTVGEHISIGTALARDLWPTLADPGEVDSAILNLVANARDAMPRGGAIQIETSNATLDAQRAAELNAEARPGDYVCLAVSDDGPGMTGDVLAKAMEPFFTTKGLGAGTGLGLASVAEFAKQTGGFVTIDSAPGRGCVVSIYLPRAAEEMAAAPGPSPSKSSCGRERLILVVEDDDEVREVTLKRLEALGYAAIEAKTGPGAVEQLNRHEGVALVLSDIIMPGGMSGYDVARWAAANRPSVKVVLCSGYNEGDRGEDAQGAGEAAVVAVLAKPYTRDQLAQTLNDAVAQGERHCDGERSEAGRAIQGRG